MSKKSSGDSVKLGCHIPRDAAEKIKSHGFGDIGIGIQRLLEESSLMAKQTEKVAVKGKKSKDPVGFSTLSENEQRIYHHWTHPECRYEGMTMPADELTRKIAAYKKSLEVDVQPILEKLELCANTN